MVDTLYASLEGIVLLIMRKRVGVPRGAFSAKRATLSSMSIRGRVRNSAQATYSTRPEEVMMMTIAS